MCASLVRNGRTLWSSTCRSTNIGKIKKDNHHDLLNHQLQHSRVYSRLPSQAKELEVSPVGSLLGWYMGILNSRPILTKSLTCAFSFAAADLSSQTMSGSSLDQFDLARTLRMTTCGLLLIGPSLHFWFNFMSKSLPKCDVISTFKKIALGQVLYNPIVYPIFLSMSAAMQGESSSEIVARLKRDLVTTLTNGFAYWIMCDFITFKFVPVPLQPLINNGFSYLWNVYLTYMANQQKVYTT